MPDHIIGIDPGATGGFAVLSSGGTLREVVALPTFGAETDTIGLAALLEAVDQPDRLYVGVEEPFANRAASSVSQLNQGIGFGQILGVLGALRIRHERIRPLDWKREMHMPMGKDLTAKQKKDASRHMAMQMWPAFHETFDLKKNDGLAEAALIAEAARRRLA